MSDTMWKDRLRTLITMSIHERDTLRRWLATDTTATRDADLIVVLDALNDRARKVAAERKADLDIGGRSVERDLAYAREMATGMVLT